VPLDRKLMLQHGSAFDLIGIDKLATAHASIIAISPRWDTRSQRSANSAVARIERSEIREGGM
jgi:hypothetical protein